MTHAEHKVWNYPSLGGIVFMSSSVRGRKKNQNRIMSCAGYPNTFWIVISKSNFHK